MDAMQTLQAKFDDDSILAEQGHDVGYCCHRNQFQKGLQHARQLIFRPSERSEQCVHQLKSYACAAKILVGIMAIAPVRI